MKEPPQCVRGRELQRYNFGILVPIAKDRGSPINNICTWKIVEKKRNANRKGYFATEIVQECRGREEELQSIRKMQESPINIYEKHMEMQRVSKEMQL